MRFHRPPFALASLLAALIPAAASPGQDLVARTDARTPQEEHKSFHLPPGFEIQLVAAEPDVHKPMNLAFDAKGRLWVTSTTLYPWPAKDDAEKKDQIKVIELNPDGSAKSITNFADGLNIPIGVIPLGDGKRAIA